MRCKLIKEYAELISKDEVDDARSQIVLKGLIFMIMHGDVDGLKREIKFYKEKLGMAE